MDLAQRIRSALGTTAREFNRALTHFDPAPGRVNTYPERMVSYYYIRALSRALASGRVLLEIPVKGKSKRGWDNHIDALIFSDGELVLAEFKVAWAPSHWPALAQDLERLRTPSVNREIRACFTDRQRRHSYVFLGADCWYRKRAETWRSGVDSGKWILPRSMRSSHRDFVCVYDEFGKDYDGYYLTWALAPFGT
jgi:hypothetical protein